MKKYKAVFFDMDGTVLDTLEDLTIALNYAMKQTRHRHDFKTETVRSFFGSGIRVAIRRALALEANPELSAADLIRIDTEAFEPVGLTGSSTKESVPAGLTGNSTEKQEPEEIRRIRTIYQPYYEQCCDDHTKPYPGVPEMLCELRRQGIRTAVISNKPDAAVQILADRLFPGMFDYAAGERSGTARKPAPDLILQTAETMHMKPDEILYVGDSEIDLQTAKNAGMDCVAVTWGFRDREMLEKLKPVYLIDSCDELTGLL